MRVLIVLSTALAIAACGKKGPTAERVTVAAEPDATEAAVEEVASEPEEVAAPEEPKILPPGEKEAKETWEVFIKEGRKFVKGMSAERIEILNQLRSVKFEEETEQYKAEVQAIADKLQDFELGDTDAVLETAPTRLCALVTEAKAESEKLLVASQDELAKTTAELKRIDDLLADPTAKEKISQKTIDKLEASQKRLSGPPLVGRYIQLVLKSLLDEALVLVDYGAQRGRRALHECLTKIAEKEFELDLAQKNLEHVIARVTKLLAIPF